MNCFQTLLSNFAFKFNLRRYTTALGKRTQTILKHLFPPPKVGRCRLNR